MSRAESFVVSAPASDSFLEATGVCASLKGAAKEQGSKGVNVWLYAICPILQTDDILGASVELGTSERSQYQTSVT